MGKNIIWNVFKSAKILIGCVESSLVLCNIINLFTFTMQTDVIKNK